MPDVIPYAKGGVQGQVGTPIQVQVQPQNRRLRLTGLLFESDKTFLLPLAVPGMKAVVDFFAGSPKAQALVNGHTDTVGARDYNRGLSSERAKSIRAFLLDDVDDWYGRYKPQQVSQPWGVREDQHMLTALGHYQGKVHGMLDAATVAAFKAFQGKSGVKQDGLPGEKTRRALILAYMKQEGTSLPPGTTVLTHGCGETHPVVDKGDERDEQQNRRVEVFLFSGLVDPKPQALCPYNGCAEYAVWVQKAKESPPVHHPGLHLDEFFARPKEHDGRSEKPHMVTVPAGSEIVLRWRAESVEKIRLTALGVDGVPADVPGVDAAAGQITLKPDAVTVYTLYGGAGDDEVEFDRQIFAVPYALEPGESTALMTGPDSLAILPQLEVKMAFSPPVDGDPPSGSDAISIPVKGGSTRNFQPAAPQVLGFKVRSDLSLGTHGGPRRALLSQFAMATAGFGAGSVGGSGDRTKAYQDLMAFGESPTQWANWAVKNVGNSSCGMYIRALWRLLGARDPADWLAVLKQKGLYTAGQYQPKNNLLEPDYENGTVINGLKYFAQYYDAFTDVSQTGLPTDVPFLRGDTFYITGAGNSQHIFSLVQDVGPDGIFYSVDGGQIAPAGSTIDDAPCCGIWPRKRGLTPDRKNFTGPDHPGDPPEKWSKGRQVRWFIQFHKLKFTGPIIEPVRNTSEPKMLLK